MTSTITFFVALVGIIVMISLKSFELKRGEKLIFSRLMERTDGFIEKIYEKIRFFLSHINRKTAIALVQWIAYHILSWVRSIYLWVHEKAHAHPHSKKVIDMVKGRGQIQKNGGASFYLKRIGEEN